MVWVTCNEQCSGRVAVDEWRLLTQFNIWLTPRHSIVQEAEQHYDVVYIISLTLLSFHAMYQALVSRSHKLLKLRIDETEKLVQ
jgi:hypothetical protein